MYPEDKSDYNEIFEISVFESIQGDKPRSSWRTNHNHQHQIFSCETDNHPIKDRDAAL
jgi:hypothetical protein